MDLFCSKLYCRQIDVVMCSFCLLASMELIFTPNCSLLYLHSNDMNSLKSLLLKKGSS